MPRTCAICMHPQRTAVERAQEEMATYRSGTASVRLAMFPSGSTLLLPRVLDRAAAERIDIAAFHLDVGYPDAAPRLADFDVVVTHRVVTIVVAGALRGL